MRFHPGLSLRAMSGSVTMQQQESVLVSMAHFTTREHGDICGHGSCWELSRSCAELVPPFTGCGVPES